MQRIEFIVNDYTRMQGTLSRRHLPFVTESIEWLNEALFSSLLVNYMDLYMEQMRSIMTT